MNATSTKAKAAVALVATVFALTSCARDPQKAKARYVDLGQKYMKKGAYGDAAIEFRNALRLDSRFVDAYYDLAQADLAQHDWRGAYAALEKVISLDPNRLDAVLERGRLLLAARQFSKAEDDANLILSQQPSDVAAYQLLGASLMGQQKSTEAQAAFSKIIELRPNDASGYVNLALVEIGLRRFDPAEQHLKKAVSLNPKATQAYIDLANFYRLQNRVADAQQALQDGIASSPNEILLYISSASMLTSQAKKDEAEAVLDKLRKQLPKSADVAISIGDFYVERKETDKALAEYRRGLSISPKNLSIEKRVEDLYLSTGQTELAAGLDEQLLKSNGKDITVRVNHGRILIAQGKPGDAVTVLQQAVRDAGDSAEGHYYLAMAHWQNGNMAQAHSALLDALKITPESPLALQALVRLSLAQHDTAGAETYAKELVQNFPASPTYRQLLAETFGRKGDIRQAEEQILIAKRLAPNDPIVHLDLASVYSAEKKWPESQKEFEAALQLDPHNTTALAEFADFLRARNQSAQAFQLAQQYVAANPNDASGHMLLGALNFDSKKYDTAQTEFERSVQIDPANVQAYLRLAKVFEATGQTDLAIARYQKAFELQPKYAPVATEIGNLYLDRNDLETARKYYQKALEADPNHAVAMANIAWVDAVEGKDLDVALGMAQKAKSEMPDVPSITDTLGWVMYRRGTYYSAIPLLQDCVQRMPSSAEYHYHLGMALTAAGKKGEGEAQLRSALQMKQLDATDTEQARQTLARNE